MSFKNVFVVTQLIAQKSKFPFSMSIGQFSTTQKSVAAYQPRCVSTTLQTWLTFSLQREKTVTYIIPHASDCSILIWWCFHACSSNVCLSLAADAFLERFSIKADLLTDSKRLNCAVHHTISLYWMIFHITNRIKQSWTVACSPIPFTVWWWGKMM